MNKQELALYFDHTILKPDASKTKVEKLCEEARTFGFKTVCVNPWWVKTATQKLAGSPVLPIAVIGFPLGVLQTVCKAHEARHVIGEGAREIDMVVNLGAYLSGDEKGVRDDIAGVVKACADIPVKVILETGYLTQQQVAELTAWSAEAGAAFVKTSTGFGPRGASTEDIRTMKGTLAQNPSWKHIGIKASGGIKTLAFMKELIAAGATRVGSSASVEIMAEAGF